MIKLKEYYNSCSIRKKINLSIIGTAGIILLITMSIAMIRSRSIVLDSVQNASIAKGEENASKAIAYFDKKISMLKSIELYVENEDQGGHQRLIIAERIKHLLSSNNDAYAIWFIKKGGSSDSTATPSSFMVGDFGESSATEILNATGCSKAYEETITSGTTSLFDPIQYDNSWLTNVVIPIKKGTEVIGAVGILLKNDQIAKRASAIMNVEDGTCKIVTKNNITASHTDPKRIGTVNDEGEQTSQIVESIQNGKQHSSFNYSEFYKSNAFKVYVPLTFSGTKSTWSFCTVIPTAKVMAATNGLIFLTIFLIVAGLLLLSIATNLIAKQMATPIKETSEQLKIITEGRYNDAQELKQETTDEIGEMVSALNMLSANLKGISGFASEVGKGNLNATISAKSEQDILGNAMVEMKQNLIAAKQAEDFRKQTDELYSWKIEGNTRVNEILRKENRSIKHLCDTALKEILTYSEAIQGGLFIIEDNGDSEKHVDLVSCIAYNRKKMQAKRLDISEGLIGRCIYEKAPIILTEIPQDYLEITSGLGDKRPDFLAIIPLINNEEMVGVLEVASFKKFDEHTLEYVQKAAESLASAISNVKINERTQKLLDQSKQFSEELGAQEEELRQNMEEMQAAQEEMVRKSEEYEATIAQLSAELESLRSKVTAQ